MTFERQPKQPQEMTEMNEIQEYYGVRNNSCNTFTIETYNGGETWIASVTGEEYREAWIAEAALESELGRCGYQVFYTIQEAEDFIREMDCDTERELNLPQETPEETEILDAAEAYHLRRGQALYWDGEELTTRSRHWSTVELVYHDLHGVGYCVVKNLSDWNRSKALELLRSHVSQETSV